MRSYQFLKFRSFSFFNPRGFNSVLKSLKEVKKIKIMLAQNQNLSLKVHKLPGDPYDFDELLIENNINSLSEALKDERDSCPLIWRMIKQ